MPPQSLGSFPTNDDEEVLTTIMTSMDQPTFSRSRSSSISSQVSSGCGSVMLPTSPKRSTATAIRCRFLNSLGITSKEAVPSLPLLNAPIARKERAHSFKETLKADYGKPDPDLLKKQSQTPIFLSGKSCGGVSFNSSVEVHPIPTRSAYSTRFRGTLWMHPMEMQQNMARNSLEFAAEGWDWRKAANDEDMVVYAGERIHPIHFMEEDVLGHRIREIMSGGQ